MAYLIVCHLFVVSCHIAIINMAPTSCVKRREGGEGQVAHLE